MRTKAELGFLAMVGLSTSAMTYSLAYNFLYQPDRFVDIKHGVTSIAFGLGAILFGNVAEMCLIEMNLHYPKRSEWMTRTIIGAVGLIILANKFK